MATAFAMALDVSVADLICSIGHGGGEIVEPDGNGEPLRRGFSAQECISVAVERGFACTQIELLPALIYPSGQKRVITFPHNGGSFQGNWERFQSHIVSSRGVIAGSGKRHGHALAYEFNTVLDPDGRPFHFTQGACETRHFYCQMLWRLDRINP